MLQRVVLGLGSNVGNREIFLKSAVKKLSSRWNFLFISASSIYETEPWGFKYQNNYLNCILVVLYRSGPGSLIREIREVENNLGRINRGKWHPREIDIDILFFGDKLINKKKLIVPHPLIRERRFVLEPLNELMPDFIHPVFHKKISKLFNKIPDKNASKLYKQQDFKWHKIKAH